MSPILMYLEDKNKEHDHVVFCRELSRKLKEITDKEKGNIKSNMPMKKTGKSVARGGKSIRVETMPPGRYIDSLGGTWGNL